MIKSSGFKIENEIEFKDATDTIEWNEHIDEKFQF